MQSIKSHPLSELFPAMSAKEFKDLVEDVKLRGVLSPVVLYEDAILDGRHRYKAAMITGTPFKVVRYEGNDPVGFTIAANLKRRHLSTSQLAMVGAKLAKLGKGQPEKKSANLPITQSTAAKSLGISTRSIGAAKAVSAASPELAKKVEDGEITLHAASKAAKEPKKEKVAGLDSDGYPIPDGCLELWNRGDEIQLLMTIISRTKGEIEKQFASEDALFRPVNQAILDHLSRSYQFLTDAKPYAVCLWCQGRNETKDKCRVCMGTGLISRFKYERDEKMHAMRRKQIEALKK